jgi:DNA repair exonuclease SbcCD ATPase subunit
MDVKALLGDAYKDGMTVEELTNALSGVEMPADQSAEIDRLKGIISAKNTEAADWKKKYQGTLDEATKRAQEKEDEHNALLERLKTLERENTVNSYKASYLSMGYDETLAKETAEAVADGNMAKVFENQKKHQETIEQRIKAEALRNAPRPGGSSGSDGGGEDADIKLARQIGKAKAESSKTSATVLNHYTK